MKIMIASDLHGDAVCVEKMLNIYHNERCEKLLLLGDILYHGPRNDLPAGYAPKRVIELLNEIGNDVIAVKGNCDAEVDEMVLNFKIHPGYIPLQLNGISVIATHGHKYGPQTPPNEKFDILLYGHTHVLKLLRNRDGTIFLNPGSVSIPKENHPCSFAILNDRIIEIVDFDLNRISSIEI